MPSVVCRLDIAARAAGRTTTQYLDILYLNFSCSRIHIDYMDMMHYLC
jgi:hypothetical protein